MTPETYRQAVDTRVGEAKRLLIGRGLPTEAYCTCHIHPTPRLDHNENNVLIGFPPQNPKTRYP